MTFKDKLKIQAAVTQLEAIQRTLDSIDNGNVQDAAETLTDIIDWLEAADEDEEN